MNDSGVRWLDPSQQRQWRALVMATTLLFDRLDDELNCDHGISLTEYEILVRLSEHEGHRMRMAQLANSLAHSRSRVTHTVGRLEDASLVQRIKSLDDGRGIDCVMTAAGFKRLQEMAPTHVEGVRAHLVDLVSQKDLAALGRVMDVVADHLIDAHPEREMRNAKTQR